MIFYWNSDFTLLLHVCCSETCWSLLTLVKTQTASTRPTAALPLSPSLALFHWVREWQHMCWGTWEGRCWNSNPLPCDCETCPSYGQGGAVRDGRWEREGGERQRERLWEREDREKEGAGSGLESLAQWSHSGAQVSAGGASDLWFISGLLVLSFWVQVLRMGAKTLMVCLLGALVGQVRNRLYFMSSCLSFKLR